VFGLGLGLGFGLGLGLGLGIGLGFGSDGACTRWMRSRTSRADRHTLPYVFT